DQIATGGRGVVARAKQTPQSVGQLNAKGTESEAPVQIVLGRGSPSLEGVSERRGTDAPVGGRRPLEAEGADGESCPRSAVVVPDGRAQLRLGVGRVES